MSYVFDFPISAPAFWPPWLPEPHFWFTGSALFTIGSFALFAILGFAGIAVGIANVSATWRRVMIFGYVGAFILFFLGWWQSAEQEKLSAQRDIQFSQFESALNKNAGSANVSLNQSATEIAAAVIAKLEPLQRQIERLSRRPNDELYQDGMPLARIARPYLNAEKTIVSFAAVTSNRIIDFSREIELQGVRLACTSKTGQPSSYVLDGANGSFTYTDVTCNILGPRQ